MEKKELFTKNLAKGAGIVTGAIGAGAMAYVMGKAACRLIDYVTEDLSPKNRMERLASKAEKNLRDSDECLRIVDEYLNTHNEEDISDGEFRYLNALLRRAKRLNERALASIRKSEELSDSILTERKLFDAIDARCEERMSDPSIMEEILNDGEEDT